MLETVDDEGPNALTDLPLDIQIKIASSLPPRRAAEFLISQPSFQRHCAFSQSIPHSFRALVLAELCCWEEQKQVQVQSYTYACLFSQMNMRDLEKELSNLSFTLTGENYIIENEKRAMETSATDTFYTAFLNLQVYTILFNRGLLSRQ
eukprot:6206486-Pleurochrysis_carterae.AAC.1